MPDEKQIRFIHLLLTIEKMNFPPTTKGKGTQFAVPFHYLEFKKYGCPNLTEILKVSSVIMHAFFNKKPI